MSTRSEAYRAQVEAVGAQRQRIGVLPEGDMWSGRRAEGFRADPRREPEPALRAVIEYLQPDDVVLDVGGGAGRYGLPLALRCRELVNVDPSPGMRRVFEDVAREARITNARFVESGWLEARGIDADLSLVAHVTYFVPDIVAFIEKLQSATRNRVCILVAAEPPPNASADLFEAVHGEPQALLPGYRELLPVLWEMEILSEVRVFEPPSPRRSVNIYGSREETVEAALSSIWLPEGEAERARAHRAFVKRFDDLFAAVDGGFRRRRLPDSRQLLITWPRG